MKSMASLKVIISFGVIFGPQLSFCQGPCIGEQCPETNRGDTSTLLQSKAGVKQVREHHQVAVTQTLDTKELPLCRDSNANELGKAFSEMNQTCQDIVGSVLQASFELEDFDLEDHKEELCPCILQISESTANSLSGCRLTTSCNCAATSVWESCQQCPDETIQTAILSVSEICQQKLGMVVQTVQAGGDLPELTELCPCLSQVPQEVADQAMDCKLPGSEYPAGQVIEQCKVLASAPTPAPAPEPKPAKCADGKFEGKINFCSEWCGNQNGKKYWGCGIGTIIGKDKRNTDNEDYTCDCTGCGPCSR